MKTQGKYDAIVAQAIKEGEPVARVMRAAGYTDRQISSCHGMLSTIKARLAPEDEKSWRRRKRLCYLLRRRTVLERLESGSSKSEAGDLQLIEAYDRALSGLDISTEDESSPYDRRRLANLILR